MMLRYSALAGLAWRAGRRRVARWSSCNSGPYVQTQSPSIRSCRTLCPTWSATAAAMARACPSLLERVVELVEWRGDGSVYSAC
eukprot:3638348-Pleurochrysis_carterae.AAC.3